jgi:PAS domain S-box-containing protein
VSSTERDRTERTFDHDPNELAHALERLAIETARSVSLQQQVDEYQAIIAAQQRDEVRFKQVIDTAMDAVVTIDEVGIITGWNAQAVSMFGLSRKEALGTNVSRIIPDELRESHAEGMRRLRDDGIGPILGHPVEMMALRSNGTRFPVDLTINRIYSDGPISYTGFIHDISLRKEAEHKLNQLHEELEQRVRDRTHELEKSNRDLYGEIRERQIVEQNLQESQKRLSEQAAALEEALVTARQASQLKSEFVARMSHEIRTPLNAVLGMTGLLMDTELTHAQHELAEDVRSSAETLLLLLNDILDFSKIEAGKLTIEAIPFNLRSAINDVVEMVAARARTNNIDLVVNIEPGMPCDLLGDAGRIRQIVTNLVDNALKFTQRGHVMIQVTTLDQTENDITLQLAVEDTGIGISPDKQDHIFDKFTQADPSTTREYGGTGLGLAICKQLVELMGGEIGVESDLGKGASFWFTLCLPYARPAASRNVSLDKLSSLRVLVADINESHSHMIEESLFGWGVKCTRCSSGVEARAALTAARTAGAAYQVALISHQLRDMSGITLANIIRAEPSISDTLLVQLRQPDQHRQYEHLEDEQFVASLAKPIGPSRLFDTLVNALGLLQESEKAGKLFARNDKNARNPNGVIPQFTINGRKPRVLVAEDNVINQRVAVLMLQKYDCRVDTVANGQEAARMLELLPYDLVFMDCHMPVMDGYEATMLIRRNETDGRRTPIVAITANTMQGDREKCLASGMDGHISKPIREEDLIRTLQWALPARGRETIRAKDQAAAELFLEKLSLGDPAQVAEFVRLFLEECPRLLARLRSAVENGNCQDSAGAAHELKGVMMHMDAARATEILRRIELGMGEDDAKTQELWLAGLEEELGNLCSVLAAVAKNK